MVEDIVKNQNLRLALKDGIWFPTVENKNISYPAEGLDVVYSIEETSFWFKHRNDCIRNTALRFLPKDYIFWDVGGGNGFVCRMLQETGYTSILVEPDIRGCRNALTRGVTGIICSTVENIGLQPGSLDAIGLFDVIEHMEHDEHILSTVHELLHEKGICFITVPAHRYLWSDIDVVSHHCRRYSLKDLVTRLEQTGFRVIYHTYFFRYFSIPLFLLRSVPYVLSGRKVKSFESAAQQAVKEHARKNEWMRKPLHWFLERESRILNHSRVWHGSSILAVATPVT